MVQIVLATSRENLSGKYTVTNRHEMLQMLLIVQLIGLAIYEHRGIFLQTIVKLLLPML